MNVLSLLAEVAGGLLSGRTTDESSSAGRPLSIRDTEGDDDEAETRSAAALDPTPITPEPWIDWKRQGRVVKIILQILFVLLAIWLKYRFGER